MRRLAFCLVLVVVPAQTTVALADPAIGHSPDSVGEPRSESIRPAIPTHATVVETREKPARLSLYIEDWGRLAELTRSDALVFSKSDFWASRRAHSVQIATTGLLLGGCVATAGTVARLAADHWTNATKWSVAGGLGVAVISLLTAWALSPDRNDLLTVINEWNLRHPDQPMAP